MRTVLACIVLALIPVSAPAQAGPAADSRPCVSKKEMNSTTGHPTKYQVEQRWEVSEMGEVYQLPVVGRTVLYPRCGKVNRFPSVFYGVVYDDHRAVMYVYDVDPAPVITPQEEQS